ncbi:MAG: hypothetical protein QOD74_591 [Variibacter sp.]|jgi:uncharacterized protein YegP (UPF0339 family)|nr:hypothetical protein [Variibacter sp.]
MYFVLYKDATQYWRWTLYAPNLRKLAESPEGYWNKNDALYGVDLIKGLRPNTPVVER